MGVEVMVYFPVNLQPNWIENVSLPDVPVISQRFQMGTDSDLSLSSIEIDGKIKCEFFLNPGQVKDLKDFWRTVGKRASFELKENFWPRCGNPTIQGFKDYSPTGLWRFESQPSFEMYLSQITFVTITIRGAIL
jgi:hypothetical protein